MESFFKKKAIFFLDEAPKFELLAQFCEKIKTAGLIDDVKTFTDAVFDRERLVSTGVGLGIALPHAKMDALNEFFIACGILKQGTCDWDSIDQLPVKVIFLIGGPSNRQLVYLKLLSDLTHRIKQKQVRSLLFKAKTTQDVLNALNG
jgi:mannitol/fructose-specific phosphotransferase system IIA component (Ntr-type)